MGKMKAQLDIPWRPEDFRADGITYEPAKDKVRLGKQAQRVWNVMRDGKWRPLDLIAKDADAPEASVSARLRDFRKDRFGGHTVERRRVEPHLWHSGYWEYRLIVRQPDEQH